MCCIMNKQMKKIFPFIFLLSVVNVHAQRTDNELERDSVLQWIYFNQALKSQAYQPVKDDKTGFTYSVWQQKITDTLIKWFEQSYLQRGLFIKFYRNQMRNSAGGAPGLHSYGTHIYSSASSFKNGKVDLNVEAGETMRLGINEFPGRYIKNFNPDDKHLFLEKLPWNVTGAESELKKIGLERGIHPGFSNYRTYVYHYTAGGNDYTKASIVISQNNGWPFKQLTVGEVLNLMDKQLANYPAFTKKPFFSYMRDLMNSHIERLQPYLNQIAIVRDGLMPSGESYEDGAGHIIINPEHIVNGYPIEELNSPELFHVVSAPQEVLDKTKTDNPLWVYMDLPKMKGKFFDASMQNGEQYLAYSLLKNFNFDYVYNFFFAAEKSKGVAYKPLNEPVKSSGKPGSAVTVSTMAASKKNEPSTILYEDFAGYADGATSQSGWHAEFGQENRYPVATVHSVEGVKGKWVSFPGHTTFYPDYKKLLPGNFTVSFDVYYKKAERYRSPFTFALVTNTSKTKQPLDLSYSVISNYETNMQFHIALDSYAENYEVTYSKRIAGEGRESSSRVISGPAKSDAAAHVTITVNGTAVRITVNDKPIMNDAGYLPPGTKFEKYGWANLSGSPDIFLSNIYIKSL